MTTLRSLLPLALLAACAAARADIDSLTDDFNGDTAGTVTSTTNFTVTNATTGGSVDVLDASSFGLDSTAYGNVVDLDGSTSYAGIFSTQQSFAPGVYTLRFDLAGSQRGDTNTVEVSLGGFDETFTRDGSDPFSTVTRAVTVASSSPLVFKNNGYDTGSDFVGALLDNVSVQAVPEPSTVAALGLGGLALLRRRDRR